MEKKLSELKLASISQYKKSFEREFGDTHFSQEKLNDIHLRIKKQATDLVVENLQSPKLLFIKFILFYFSQFQSKLTQDDLEFSGTFCKQLDVDLANEFLPFKLKNNEKEKKAIVSSD